MVNKSVSFAQYFYRVNADGTLDSICGYCFLTVATADTENELRRLESAHRCGRSSMPLTALSRSTLDTART